MSKVYHIGDLHLGHRNILKYRKGFSAGCTADDHDHAVVSHILYTISKRDTLILHGDIFFSSDVLKKWASEIAKYCGNVHLVLGNHDFEHMSKQEKLACFGILNDLGYNIHGLHKNKMFWWSHAPVHESELRGKFNIHGHVHNQTIDDWRYVNVSWDNCYRGQPVDLDMIKEHVNDQKVFRGDKL